MKKFNVQIIFVISIFISAIYAFAGSGGSQYIVPSTTIADNIPTIAKYKNLSTAVHSTNILIVNSLCSCNNLTIPKTTTLYITGNYITVNSGKTLNFNGNTPIAGNYQIFSGNGNIANINDVKVEWFGAKNDSLTDNTTAFQSSINTAIAKVKFMTYSGNYYKITYPIAINKNGLDISGDNIKCRIKNTSNNQQIFIITPGSNNLEIHHLKLEDSGTYNATYKGRSLIQTNINATAINTSNLKIHDIWFKAGAISGTSANYLTDSFIYNNIFDNDGANFGEHGVYLSTGCKNNRIYNNNMRSIGLSNGQGITSNSAIDNSVSNIMAYNNFISGFSYGIIPSSTNNSIQSKWIIKDNILIGTTDSTGDGIKFFSVSPSDFEVSGNLITGFQGHGISDSTYDYNGTISGNKIFNNGLAGMRFVAATRCKIVNNYVIDNNTLNLGHSGIELYGTTYNTYNEISGNTSNVTDILTSYQQYGLSYGGGTGNRIFNNNFSPNVLGEIDAIGTLAIGPAPITVSVGASPFSYFNPYTQPIIIYLTPNGGSNISSVESARIGGGLVTIGAPATGSGYYILPAGDLIRISYSVAPPIMTVLKMY